MILIGEGVSMPVGGGFVSSSGDAHFRIAGMKYAVSTLSVVWPSFTVAILAKRLECSSSMSSFSTGINWPSLLSSEMHLVIVFSENSPLSVQFSLTYSVNRILLSLEWSSSSGLTTRALRLLNTTWGLQMTNSSK